MKIPKFAKKSWFQPIVFLLALVALRTWGSGVWSVAPSSIQQAANLYVLPITTIALLRQSANRLAARLSTSTLSLSYQTKQPLLLGWILDSGASSITSVVQQTPGLSVLSPKWFHVDGLHGAVFGNAEPSVIAQAHAQHLQVWAVVDNGFNGSLSHRILQYQDQQDELIGNIVNLAVSNRLNGINLDFEGLNAEDRWNYSRFVSVLANQLHKKHILLSVDLPPDYVAGKNTGPYNHQALAAAADDIVLMGYDEYWLGDTTAGPTASLPWLRMAVDDFLKTGVPARKLILGIPFYAEDWTLNKQGKVVSSVALSATGTEQLVTQLHAQVTWNAREGLYYTTYQYHGMRHEIWLEDKRTLMLFTELARNDHMAGVATWYLGLENKSTWLSVLHTLRSPTLN